MWLILQAPKPEDVVIATGVQHSVREFAQLAFHHVGIELKWEGKVENEKSICVSGPEHQKGKTLVEVSPDFYRPTDVVNLCSILPSTNRHVSSNGKSCSLWQTLSRSKRRTLHSKVQPNVRTLSMENAWSRWRWLLSISSRRCQGFC